MKTVFAESARDLKYFWMTKRLILAAGLIFVGVLISFSGSFSQLKFQHKLFSHQVQVAAKHGEKLSDALQKPLEVIRDQQMETITNPMKYEYLELAKLAQSVRLPGFIATATEFITYLVIPLLFIYLGLLLATYDRESRTAQLRTASASWAQIRFSKILSILILAGLVPVAVLILAVTVGLVTSGISAAAIAEIRYELVRPTSNSNVILKYLFTVGTAVFFGVIGLGLGALLRSKTIPLVISAVILFAIPMAGSWDFRNGLTRIGTAVFDFWGQFRLMPIEPKPIIQDILLLGLPMLFAIGIFLVAFSVKRQAGRGR